MFLTLNHCALMYPILLRHYSQLPMVRQTEPLNLGYSDTDSEQSIEIHR